MLVGSASPFMCRTFKLTVRTRTQMLSSALYVKMGETDVFMCTSHGSRTTQEQRQRCYLLSQQWPLQILFRTGLQKILGSLSQKNCEIPCMLALLVETSNLNFRTCMDCCCFFVTTKLKFPAHHNYLWTLTAAMDLFKTVIANQLTVCKLLLTTGQFWPDNLSIGQPFKFKKVYFMILLWISENVRMAKQSWIWLDKSTCQTTCLILQTELVAY